MSLKAKIEAVIYAAEEPVTLAQLAALFGEEVQQSAVPRGDSASGGASDDSVAQPLLETTTPPGADEAELDNPRPGEAEPPAADGKKAERLRDRAIRDGLRSIIAVLSAEYESGDRGMEVREIAGGYRIATKPEYHDAVRSFARSLRPPMKLSLQALETLAVIAYKQPVTAPEVNEIRGVDSGGVLGSLMSRKLITTAGRKHVIGRPILYKTTREFLLRFGLKDISELPSIEEFEKMAGDMEVEDLSGNEDVGHEQLPFEHSSYERDPDAVDADEVEGDAVEANAGEPGISVAAAEQADRRTGDSSGAEELAHSGEAAAPKVVALDSFLAVEQPSRHEVELVAAVHPATTLDGE